MSFYVDAFTRVAGMTVRQRYLLCEVAAQRSLPEDATEGDVLSAALSDVAAPWRTQFYGMEFDADELEVRAMSDEREYNNERETVHDAQDREKRRAPPMRISDESVRAIADLVVQRIDTDAKEREALIESLRNDVARAWEAAERERKAREDFVRDAVTAMAKAGMSSDQIMAALR